MQKENESVFQSCENSVFSLAVLSVIGGRKDQEDSFGYKIGERNGMVTVCDGMGGHVGGSRASRTAVSVFLRAYDEMMPESDPVETLLQAAKDGDRAVSELTYEDGNRMNAGSTAVTLLLLEKELYWCSVGDSRAVLKRGAESVQLTLDQNYQTVLEERLRAGLISETEFKEEEKKGEGLISYLGIGNLSLVDYNDSPLSLESGDQIIVMTDGLYKLVPEEEIVRVLDNFVDTSDALRVLDLKADKAARKKGTSRDNMTAAVITVK